MKKIRMVVVADGNPHEVRTNSGVARGITRALGHRERIELLTAASTRPSGWRKLALAAATFRPSRRAWWIGYNFGSLSLKMRSAKRDRAVRNAGYPPVDCILQVRNIYAPSKIPYFVFIDAPYAMSVASWNGWTFGAGVTRRRLKAERIQFRNATHIFTAGRPARASVIAAYAISPEKVTAIGGGVNIASPSSQSEITDLNEKRRLTKNILFVGTEWERKGGDVLLDAFDIVRRTHPTAVLTLVGADLVGDMGTNVRSLGMVREQALLRELYEDAAVFCLPARYEPYGLVVPEAMAFGLPCVATNVGAIPEMITSGTNGVLVEPEDAVSLAAALSGLLDNPQERSRMGSAAFDRSRSMTWESVADRMIEVIARTLAS